MTREVEQQEVKQKDCSTGESTVRVTTSDPYILVNRALDPDFMLQVFQRELPLLADRPVRLNTCRIRANKTRTAVGLTRVQIRYWVTGESDGQNWERVLLGTLPVTSEFLSHELLQQCHAAQGHPAVQPFQRLAAFIPQLQMGVQFFPVDVAMPSLLAVTRPDSGQLLSRFIPECRAGATIEEVRWQLVHYKPGDRCVYKCTVRLSSVDEASFHRTVYVKLFADDGGEVIHRLMQELWRTMHNSVCLRMPQPYGYHSEHRMLVMAEVPGDRDLKLWVECLEAGKPLPPGVDLARLVRCMAVTAEALAELHRSEIRPPEVVTFHAELKHQRKELHEIRCRLPELAVEVERVQQRLEAGVLYDERLVPSHGAFRHKQILGNDQCLTFVDFDDLTLAHPAWDAACFLGWLRLEPLKHPGKVAASEYLAEIFRREFLVHESEVSPHHLAVYEALVLMKIALRAFRGFLQPERSDKVVSHVRELVAGAHRLLDGVSAGSV
jgi:aminoglycoside phosphotransferase (APT) family kinase protein